MSVATVVVPVPASGDGLAVSVAALLGSKTVVLTGQFEGTYVLLASHDGATYVPAITFNSGGPEGVQATLDDAYNFVRLRSSATPLGTVTASVTAVTSGGMNYFAALPIVAPGASGPQAVVDTWALFPPTGLEAGLNFACRGAFTGSVVVEASSDGVAVLPARGLQHRTDSAEAPLRGCRRSSSCRFSRHRTRSGTCA